MKILYGCPGRVKSVIILLFLAQQVLASSCLYVSSYHKGYEWNDGIEEGIERTLKGKCDLSRHYMDTKRNKSRDFGVRAGLLAKAVIEKEKPDVVIACDDNASRYLVKPHYRNKELPIVFCGVNHNVKEYAYPYSNVTGMIEISPVRQILKVVRYTLNKPKKGVYIGVDVVSQHKEFALNLKHYNKAGIKLEKKLIRTMAEWVKAYEISKGKADFIILGDNGGMADWDPERAYKVAENNNQTLTLTNYPWMAKFSMVSITKDAREQGEWAAKVALEILSGTKPEEIPIVVNRVWKVYVNKDLVAKTALKLPKNILLNAMEINVSSKIRY